MPIFYNIPKAYQIEEWQ